MERVVTLAEFQTTSEFLACSPKMRLWLLTLIESDWDYTLATLTAFNSKSRSQAQRFSHAVRNWPKIKTALNLYLGKTPQEILLDQVELNLQKAKPGSPQAVNLLVMKQDLLKKNAEAPAVPAQPAKTPEASMQGFKVGQEVFERDGKGVMHAGIVIAVDAAGQVTGITEVKLNAAEQIVRDSSGKPIMVEEQSA